MLDLFWVHSAAVETLQGAGAAGGSYAAPVTVPGMMDDSTHMVRTASNEEIVAQSTFYADIQYADLFTVDSKVTFNGRLSRVITMNSYDVAALPLPAHVEVHLT